MKRLLVGYRAADLTPELLAGDVTCHALDIHHAHAIERTCPGAKVVCAAHLPRESWDEIRFRTGPKIRSGELSLSLLQEIHLLRPRAFALDFVGRERDRNDLLDKIRKDPDRVRDFAATWPASVPGGKALTFTSFPGCFCHRRRDEGGLALAEVVSRELSNTETQRHGEGEFRMLDMGCGCGLVGLLVASRLSASTSSLPLHLTLIDSHSRAIEAAELNARTFGIPVETILADDGIAGRPDLRGTFAAFMGNPPYYSDYRIADVFLETAKAALRPGGVCYMVCKNAAGLEPVQRRHFPSVQIIPRRGYAVLKSIMV